MTKKLQARFTNVQVPKEFKETHLQGGAKVTGRCWTMDIKSKSNLKIEQTQGAKRVFRTPSMHFHSICGIKNIFWTYDQVFQALFVHKLKNLA